MLNHLYSINVNMYQTLKSPVSRYLQAAGSGSSSSKPKLDLWVHISFMESFSGKEVLRRDDD